MTIEVQGPGGVVVEFPDGTAPAVMRAALTKHFGGGSAPDKLASIRANVDSPASIEPLRQFARQFSAGGSEALAAGLTAAGGALRGVPFSQGYAAARQEQERETAARHNSLNDGAGWAGGLAPIALGVGATRLGLAAGREAVPLAARLGKSALASAGIGAFAGGANATRLQDIPVNALGGGVVGGFLGTAAAGAPAVTAGARRQIGSAFRTGASTLSGAAQAIIKRQAPEVAPEVAAAARPAARNYLLQRFPAAVDKLAGAHSSMTAGEALGPSGVNQQIALTRRPGIAVDTAQSIMQPRGDARPGRLLSVIHAATGIDPAGASEGVASAVRRGKAAADPMFEAIRSDGSPVMTPELAALAQRPAIRKALPVVADNLLNAGRDPHALGIRVDPDTGTHSLDVNAQTSLRAMTQNQPTAETWEAVRQALGGQVQRHPLTGARLPDSEAPGNFGIDTARRDLTAAMADAIPGHADAVATAGDYQKLKGAFNAGKGQLFGQSTPAEFKAALAARGAAPEADAFRHAIASDLYDKAGRGGLVPRAILKAPDVQAKLSAAFGDDAAKSISDAATREAVMQGAEGRVAPLSNSVTGVVTEIGKEHDAAGGALGRALQAALTKGVGHAAMGTVLAPAEGALSGALAPGNLAFRNELARMLFSKPGDLAAELQAHVAAKPPSAGPGPLSQVAPLEVGRPHDKAQEVAPSS